MTIAQWMAAVAVTAMALSGHAASAAPGCTASSQSSEPRQITSADLLALGDIGPSSVLFDRESPLGVSPDGRRLAFQIRQADPGSNAFCLGMYVLDLDRNRTVHRVDAGGELLRVHFQRGALARYPSGDARMIVPKWSPDGSTIGFLKQTDRQVRLWIARADGGESVPVSPKGLAVEDFAWSRDGQTLVIKARIEPDAEAAEIKAEANSGFHYDGRWSPIASNRPWPATSAESRMLSIDRMSFSSRAATPGEERLLAPSSPSVDGPAPSLSAEDETAVAWVSPIDPGLIYSLNRLHVRLADGRTVPCAASACSGSFAGLWWDRTHQRLWFLRREGWALSELGLYVWTPGRGSPRRTLITQDLLLGCQRARAALLCLTEGSASPRSVVSIDPMTGARTTLFDPNGWFHQLSLGRVERLHWTSSAGVPTFADLVLPPRAAARPHLPMILVQYETRGFLRGGTGDEYPIFPLAAHGFAILSMQRPRNVSTLSPVRDRAEKVRADYADWTDKRNVLSAMERGIGMLVGRGIVDPQRVGITGLSDGATTAQFALLNSDAFAAAALSSCCEDPKTLLPLMGAKGAAYLHSYLYPAYTAAGSTFWAPYSIAQNAAHFSTPLLLQTADDEYLASLETYTSLTEYHQPVDLFVYPDEHHTKWQPAHRMAVYDRNIDWFDFWLQNREDRAPEKREQYARWRALRAARLAGQHDPVSQP